MPGKSKQALLKNAVSAKIHKIQGALLGNNPKTQARAKAILAKLRKAAIKPGAADPEAWQLVLGATGLAAGGEESDLLPIEIVGTGDDPNPYESSAYTVITMYAIHQQSQQKPMHQKEKRFATAVGELVSKTSPSVKTRFDSLAKAQNQGAVHYHLRSLVTLLRANEIGFDYGLLAVDLKQLATQKSRQKVLIRWSRDFVAGYRPSKPKPDDTAA